MAIVVAHDQYLVFDGVNLTNSLASDIKFNLDGKEIDVTTLGSSWGQFRQGQTGLTISVSGVWDSGTAATSLDTKLYNAMDGGGTKLYEYMPAGSASNNILYKANCVLISYNMGGAVGDKVGFALTLKGADQPNRSTLA